MKIERTSLPGVLTVEPKVFRDPRGFFFESWHRERYAAAGIAEEFVQDNVSRSSRGTLRGLHVQHPSAQGKLVSVLEGEAFDVAVDVRRGSPWFGQSLGFHLSGVNQRQVYVPPGFAHGFQVLSESALVLYKTTAYYRPESEIAILWSDRSLGIAWPISDPTLSDKDRQGTPLLEIPSARLPTYE